MINRTVIVGAGEVLTCRPDASDRLGRIPGGQVLIEGDRIVAVGRLGDASAENVIDADGGVVMPGFVDCHTHAIFGGSRVDEYAASCAGTRPPAGAPVGILGTVTSTRPLGPQEMADASRERLAQMLAHGTTTVEVKSGYGLDAVAEPAMLEAGRLLSDDLGIGVVSTFMGAHSFPPEVDRDAYVTQVCEMIPAVAERGLASFCDVYCDDGYFTVDETQRILGVGLENGLRPKVHMDAYSHTSAAGMAARLGAVTADHLNHTPPEELETLAEAGVIGVAMPLLDFAVAHERPTIPRVLARHGVRVAIATDCCPGCYATSMQLAIQHACRTGGLSVADAIRAATIDAAAAVGCENEVGSLEPGKRADVLVLDTDRFEDLAYRLGHNAVRNVISGGVAR
jgi:imidazolonepropionase